MFPKTPDYHKPGKPLVPTGLGAIYVLASTIYLFLLHIILESSTPQIPSKALTLAACILFGGFMGLLDDWMDLRWRYKAFLPLIAAVPLSALAYRLPYVRTSIGFPIIGTIDFGNYYFLIVIPIIVTVVTNTVNQLGGLNGLETICPAIILTGLMLISGFNAILLFVPLAVWFLLAVLNFQGKIFVGNTGSFAIGITLAAFAIISDLKWTMLISLAPYILNSSLILLNYFIFGTKAKVSFDGKKLSSDHRRSLITLITYRRQMSERQVVIVIAGLVAASTLTAMLIHIMAY